MKGLKTLLILLYPALLLLLLLSTCSRGCSREEADPVREPVRESVREEPRDNAEDMTEGELEERAREVGGEGNLKVTLLWDFRGDIDLHVVEPGGERINWMHTRSATGGYLDRDNQRGGSGSAENAYWETPPAGTYNIYLDYYVSPEIRTTRESGTCKVLIMQPGKATQTYTVPMDPTRRGVHVAGFTF